MVYNFKKIEKKWRDKWEKDKIFKVEEDKKKKKYYVLEMYPYPSASGLHMGHAFNYVIGDVLSRFRKMQGFNVLHPMGYDSFGLPAENAAIKENSHPRIFTEEAIKNYVRQQKMLGLSYDWSRMLMSHNPEYYKWNQWIFLKMFEKGLAYRKKAPVNWCGKCNTVLANEQVHNGKCWRHTETEVEIKNLEQWFIRTTKYADELYEKVDSLDWPERIKIMQKNWIGKSEGTEIDFFVNGKKFPIFTTRPDTLFGVTFMVISSQHSELMGLVSGKQKKEVEKFLKKIKSTKQEDLDKLDKEGVFTGSYATHPLTKEKIPIYAGNFVLADYGSGMVMAVPAHDQRDFEFAKKYKLPIRQVISGGNVREKAYTGTGNLINSKDFNGLFSEEAKEHITKALEFRKLGRKTTNYKLKDWLISRQRYWGTPIPIVYCEKCGIVPVLEKDLPVLLPEKVKFGKGNPLETNNKFLKANCPKCGKKGRRETDTMDTFFDSSWYFLRFCDNKNKKKIFDEKKVKYWMPVDFYTGGAEHACMHLIYARFFTKVLRDFKLVEINEPFKRLFNQGMVHGEDGFVMSKSRGNMVFPEQVSDRYGIDTARLFLMSISSPDKDTQWSENGIEGSSKFINKFYEFFQSVKFSKSSKKLESKLNKTLKEFTDEVENLRYNLGIIKIRKLFELMQEEKNISKKDVEIFLQMLHLFCPYVTEELWNNLGNKKSILFSEWPKFDESKINDSFEKEEGAIEKIVSDINNILKIVGKKEKVYVYTLPNEKDLYHRNVEEIKKRTSIEVKVFSVSDKEKYGPKGFSKKAKFGKPAIYVE